MVEHDLVLRGSALKGHTRRFGSAPALTVIDAPRVNHDNGGSIGAKSIRHLDDAPGIVAEPPGSDFQVRFGIVDQDRRLEAGSLADWLDEPREIRQDRSRVRQRYQPVFIDPG